MKPTLPKKSSNEDSLETQCGETIPLPLQVTVQKMGIIGT